MDNFDSNKSYAILGLGLSGLASAKFLIANGVRKLFLSDPNPLTKLSESTQKFLAQNTNNFEIELGIPHSDKCLEYDCLVVSPGISPEAEILQKAHQHKRRILTEVELAGNLVNNFIGITGTNGKSTTTALTAHLLKAPACGNIGIPFTQALQENPDSANFVCELSSFQLSHSNRLKPKIAAITNITPDHISWHGSWEAYLEAKAKITQFQDQTDWLILPNTAPLNKIKTKAQIFWVECQPLQNSNFDNAVWVNASGELFIKIHNKTTKVLEITQLPLPGWHNTENAMFALVIALLSGLPLEEAKERLLTFKGLEHRLEFVREVSGKSFYNDSKATNPESTIVALKAFDEPIIWLAGGRDKLTNLSEMINEVKKKVSSVILFGEAAARFSDELNKAEYQGKIYIVKNLEEAIPLALKQNGKIVLLSPACASFDQFKSFEERGKYFKNLVLNIPDKITIL